MLVTSILGLLRQKECPLLVQTVRHMAKAVTRHRRPMHIVKEKLMAVTEYVPPTKLPAGAYPEPARGVQEDDQYILLMKKNLEKIFQECKMVAVVQNNGCNSEDLLIFKHKLHKHGIRAKFFSSKVTRSFLRDSIYSNLTPLFAGPVVLLVSEEPKAKELLTTLRASPQMTLLGACIDNALLSPQGVLNYSKLPSLTVVQGELISGLTVLTSQTSSLLQHHPAHLCALLQQHVKHQSSKEDSEGAT